MLKELLAANIDLYIDQGDTYYKVFTIRDNNGTVVNLTGLEVTVIMKRYFNTETEYELLAEVVTPLAGVISLNMTADLTQELTSDRYVYAVRLSDGNDTTKIMHGQVLVTPL